MFAAGTVRVGSAIPDRMEGAGGCRFESGRDRLRLTRPPSASSSRTAVFAQSADELVPPAPPAAATLDGDSAETPRNGRTEPVRKPQRSPSPRADPPDAAVARLAPVGADPEQGEQPQAAVPGAEDSPEPAGSAATDAEEHGALPETRAGKGTSRRVCAESGPEARAEAARPSPVVREQSRGIGEASNGSSAAIE